MPPKEEQLQAVEEIELRTAALNTAIARTEREIALMQEYRTRLTADIVTGKLDVRAAAARLPAETAADSATGALEEEPDTLEESEVKPAED